VPQEGGWCPIYGTLKGTGTLAGPFRFTGDDNRWEVTGRAGSRELGRVDFANPTKETFVGLKALDVTFSGKPGSNVYFLTSGVVTNLADTDLANMVLTVIDENSGKDYSEVCRLAVIDGRPAFINGLIGGTTIIIR